jgi:prevent-host-death family protein
MRWQLQEAKQRFSEVVRQAEGEGPQVVTRHGRDVAVIVAADEYRRLTGGGDFKAFLRGGPDLDELEIERPPEMARRVQL